MATPYDYVQIITDDNWALVGIIPNNGSKNKNENDHVEKKSLSNDELTGHRTFSEATVVNKRRPINPKISEYSSNVKHMGNSLITPAEISITGRNFNPNVISGINALEPNILQMSQSYKKIEDSSDLKLFGEISNLTGVANVDNILIGFGR